MHLSYRPSRLVAHMVHQHNASAVLKQCVCIGKMDVDALIFRCISAFVMCQYAQSRLCVTTLTK